MATTTPPHKISITVPRIQQAGEHQMDALDQLHIIPRPSMVNTVCTAFPREAVLAVMSYAAPGTVGTTGTATMPIPMEALSVNFS